MVNILDKLIVEKRVYSKQIYNNVCNFYYKLLMLVKFSYSDLKHEYGERKT